MLSRENVSSRMRELIGVVRREGLPAACKRLGWKTISLLVAYYLVRDVTLYIVIPTLVARAVASP